MEISECSGTLGQGKETRSKWHWVPSLLCVPEVIKTPWVLEFQISSAAIGANCIQTAVGWEGTERQENASGWFLRHLLGLNLRQFTVRTTHHVLLGHIGQCVLQVVREVVFSWRPRHKSSLGRWFSALCSQGWALPETCERKTPATLTYNLRIHPMHYIKHGFSLYKKKVLHSSD